MHETGSVTRQLKAKQELENKLLEELRLRHRQWKSASEENFDLARQRFINALDAFKDFALYGNSLTPFPFS